MRRIFITGTDTGIGKTTLARALVYSLVTAGQQVAALKPVASGCEQTPDGLRNRDAEGLQTQANVQLNYEQVNPYAFEPPIAPHIAARDQGVTVDVEAIENIASGIDADWLIVEGVGGWQVPLGEDLMQTDLVRALDCEVLLVAGIQLGCLNHTLLTADRIRHDGFSLTAWAGNLLDQRTLRVEDQICTLRQCLDAPFLGLAQRCYPPLPAALAAQLDFRALGY